MHGMVLGIAPRFPLCSQDTNPPGHISSWFAVSTHSRAAELFSVQVSAHFSPQVVEVAKGDHFLVDIPKLHKSFPNSTHSFAVDGGRTAGAESFNASSLLNIPQGNLSI